MMIFTGLIAGTLLGFVLQRGGLCFHSMFASAGRGDTRLLRGWLLGVGIGSVLLSLLYLSSAYGGLNEGLAFRPVRNILGGLLIGVGMAVARSCASGLFYKLGTGMLGAGAGIAGWILGEYAASRISYDGFLGTTALGGGEEGTFAGVLGLPRLVVSIIVLVLAISVCRLLVRRKRADLDSDSQTDSGAYDSSQPDHRWGWQRTGVALGVVLVLGWVLAGAGGAGYGPSTVGATASVVAGSPNWWLIAFLAGLVPGGNLGARVSGDLRVRGEQPVRYAQLAAGGVLLGAGGWIGGGCNLGHGLSGVAQLNVASWVAVLAMALGVIVSRRLLDARRTGARGSRESMAR